MLILNFWLLIRPGGLHLDEQINIFMMKNAVKDLDFFSCRRIKIFLKLMAVGIHN